MCDIPLSIPAQPSGPVNGLTGTSYIYNASTTDAEGDDIVYCIDFGDDTGEVCVGPFPSGTCASVSLILGLKKEHIQLRQKQLIYMVLRVTGLPWKL